MLMCPSRVGAVEGHFGHRPDQSPRLRRAEALCGTVTVPSNESARLFPGGRLI